MTEEDVPEISLAEAKAAYCYAEDLNRLVFDLDPEDGWRDRYFALHELERYLVAVILARWDVDNGGLDQFFRNYTGFFTPEAILGYRWLGMPLAADGIETASQRLGKGDIRDQSFRRSATKELWAEREGWEEEETTLYYSAFKALSREEWERKVGERAIREGLYPRLRDSRFDQLPPIQEPEPPPPIPW